MEPTLPTQGLATSPIHDSSNITKIHISNLKPQTNENELIDYIKSKKLSVKSVHVNQDKRYAVAKFFSSAEGKPIHESSDCF